MSAELWERLVGVNLHGCFATCRAAAAVMRAQGMGGRIVVTSSVHAQMPFAQMGVYGGTKQAVGHLVGVMAREWAPDGITVNHIGPGWVASAINDRSPDFATPEAQAGVRRIIPLGHRPGEPEEMGEAVAYLASDAAGYTTGAYIRVDGGLVIGPY
jgi:NAD(P)-dependent dehydrogenase (short-subunit alcohol dehydrogenase family)